ncbi:MAG TPA: hypothetical protein VEG30_00585 [Terriglobales bacterium]|nr:hypothetical protein [Terriglobales bacterium]
MKRWFSLAAIVVISCCALMWSQTTKTQDSKPAETQQEALKQFGSTDSAKWTDTSKEAAATDEQKAWLNKGKPETISGEVVDVSCYMQLGKTGAKHADCGGKCVKNGQPIGILTSSKELYLVIPEEHHPRRDGQTNIRDAFAAQMGKQVKVTGMVQQTPQGKAIFVSNMDVQKSGD